MGRQSYYYSHVSPAFAAHNRQPFNENFDGIFVTTPQDRHSVDTIAKNRLSSAKSGSVVSVNELFSPDFSDSAPNISKTVEASTKRKSKSSRETSMEERDPGASTSDSSSKQDSSKHRKLGAPRWKISKSIGKSKKSSKTRSSKRDATFPADGEVVPKLAVPCSSSPAAFEHSSIWSENEALFISDETSRQHNAKHSHHGPSFYARIAASVSGRSSIKKQLANKFSNPRTPVTFSCEIREPASQRRAPGTASQDLDPMSQLLLGGMTSDDIDTVEISVCQLAKMCHDGDGAPKNRDKAMYLGAHTMLLHTMRLWSSDEAMQAACLGCLTNLLYNNSQLVGALSILGGMEHILHAMSRFPYSGEVQLKGLCVLRNLFGTRYNENQALAKRFVVELKGCQVIVAAMTGFIDDSEVQINGLYTMDNLCLIDKKLKAYVVHDGGVTAAGKALDNHPSNYRVKETAQQLTSIFSDNSRVICSRGLMASLEVVTV